MHASQRKLGSTPAPLPNLGLGSCICTVSQRHRRCCSAGIRMVFVLGRNPVMLTDGTGVTHDTEEVAAEAKAHGDLLRVDALHKDGSDGRAQLMHDLWQVLPVKYSAYFYAKAQVCCTQPWLWGLAAECSSRSCGL